MAGEASPGVERLERNYLMGYFKFGGKSGGDISEGEAPVSQVLESLVSRLGLEPRALALKALPKNSKINRLVPSPVQ